VARKPGPACAEGKRLCNCAAGQQVDLIPETFLNSRDSNVRFAGEENEIFVTVTTLGSRMPSQDGRKMGVAGLEEFLERKTLAVPVLGAPA
jgi:hypothetical protein